MNGSADLLYVPLWCKSNYSFLEGASFPEQYIAKAAELQLPSIALTDRDGIYGSVKAHVAAQHHNIHLIVGSEITVKTADNLTFTILFLAQDDCGYANLCSLITTGRRRCEKGKSEVSVHECCDHTQGLIAIWLPNAVSTLKRQANFKFLGMLKDAFGNRLWMMICRHFQTRDPVVERQSRLYAKHHAIRTVAGREFLYHCASEQPIQDVISCIRQRITLSSSKNLLQPNTSYGLIESRKFLSVFRDDPGSVHATCEIAQQCSFRLDQVRYTYPQEVSGSELTSDDKLRKLTYAGAAHRFDKKPPEALKKQLQGELNLISELGYSSYFLTMHRIVKWCEQQNILCQGRGSAANSAVCFCLGITHIDPIDMDLLFERFLSRERDEPPDIDLDIEHKRREEVIQYVYRTYGRDHAAMVAVVIRYRIRSAVRDVGAVLDIPEAQIQRLSKQLDHHGQITPNDFVKVGLNPSIHNFQLLIRLSNALVGFPRHLSIHPGGFVFTTAPIHQVIPVENATMAERTVIQWEKDDIETMKIFKVDLLGLGALTQLHRCFDLIWQHHGIGLDMHSIPKDDPAVFAMLQKADTTGVFQIESRAQMSMLPRLKPRQWYDLVVQIAIVRPGPITGGMVHPYLRRRSAQEPVEYPHPCLEPVLGKTLGVPIFQEQVIKLAMVAADYQPGEADQLRRDMAAWRRVDRIEQHREKLICRMTAKGIDKKFAEQVFDQIRGFGEYGFPESHSASFALIAYAASYLKCHYPAHFACSLLNSQPMGFYAPATIIEDARRHGVHIAPVDIRFSARDCTLEADPASAGGQALRIGLRYIKGLNEADLSALENMAIEKIQSVDDLIHEVGVSKSGMQKLAQAGALASLTENRRSALWAALGAHTERDIFPAIDSQARFDALSAEESTAWDYQSTAVSSDGHMLQHYREYMSARGLPDAKTVNSMKDGCRVRYVGAVICRQRPASASSVVFMTLEDESGFVNAVFWPKCFERYSTLAKTLALIGIEGKLQVAGDVVHLIVEHVWDPGHFSMWEKYKSRNFH